MSLGVHIRKCLSIYMSAAAAAKSLQSCPTLCDPIDSSPPGSAVPGILRARILEWVAISFSNAWKWKVKVKSLSRVRLLATPWTAAHQAPPSMGFSRQEYWSGVPLPSPIYVYMSTCMQTHQEISNKLCLHVVYFSLISGSVVFFSSLLLHILCCFVVCVCVFFKLRTVANIYWVLPTCQTLQ